MFKIVVFYKIIVRMNNYIKIKIISLLFKITWITIIYKIIIKLMIIIVIVVLGKKTHNIQIVLYLLDI